MNSLKAYALFWASSSNPSLHRTTYGKPENSRVVGADHRNRQLLGKYKFSRDFAFMSCGWDLTWNDGGQPSFFDQ